MTTEKIVGMSFSTSEQAAKQTEELRRNLGLSTKAQVARMAIGLSLGLDYDTNLSGCQDYGKRDNKVIKDETLFGDGVGRHLWLALLVEDQSRRGAKVMRELVSWHWHRGAGLLAQDWRDAEQEDKAATEQKGVYARFVDKLMRRAALPEIVVRPPGISDASSLSAGEQPAAGAVCLRLGQEAASQENFTWTVNGVGYAPHIAIMGQAGSGKTRVMLEAINQIHTQTQAPVLLLDLGKGDLADNSALAKELGATVSRVPENPIPLDMFYGSDSSGDSASDAVLGFRDSLVKVIPNNVGGNQREHIREALKPLFQANQRIPLEDVRNSIKTYYEENDIKTDSVVSAMGDLTERLIFRPETAPADFFSRSWIITFAGARDTVKNLAVYLLLDTLNAYMKSLPEAPMDEQGHRAIRMVLAIDEARPLLASRHQALSDIIRLHRSKGLVVALVSQSPDDYDGAGDAYLENIGLPICLKTNAKATAVIQNMFKGKADFAALSPGVCLTLKDGAVVQVKVF
jgi:hypothetical protein